MIVTSVLEYEDVISYKNWDIKQDPCDFNRVYYIQGGTAFYDDANNNFIYYLLKHNID